MGFLSNEGFFLIQFLSDSLQSVSFQSNNCASKHVWKKSPFDSFYLAL